MMPRLHATPRDFGPLQGYEEGYTDKISAMMDMFAAAGPGGVISVDLAEEEKIESQRLVGGKQHNSPLNLTAVRALTSYGKRALELNLQEPEAAFRYAQEAGVDELQRERQELRDAVKALSEQAESIQLGFMTARADDAYAVLSLEWLSALDLPGPTAGPQLNAPTVICEQQSFLHYDSGSRAKHPSEKDEASVFLRPFDASTRGVLFMPRFDPASESDDGQWSLTFGELPMRLFFIPPPRVKFDIPKED